MYFRKCFQVDTMHLTITLEVIHCNFKIEHFWRILKAFWYLVKFMITKCSKFGSLQNLAKICFFLRFAKLFLKKIQKNLFLRSISIKNFKWQTKLSDPKAISRVSVNYLEKILKKKWNLFIFLYIWSASDHD